MSKSKHTEAQMIAEAVGGGPQGRDVAHEVGFRP